MYMLSYIVYVFIFFFFKQKTAYEMRISDWSSDVCSSDLDRPGLLGLRPLGLVEDRPEHGALRHGCNRRERGCLGGGRHQRDDTEDPHHRHQRRAERPGRYPRSEEHTSELQSLMRISYAVFCLKKKKNTTQTLRPHEYTITERITN